MLLKVKEKGKLGGGDQILGVLKFFKSALMTKLSMCSIQFLLLLYHFLCVYANVILWSNSGSFLPDILPPFSLNPGFHTEASWIQKQSCMQSCIYVNPTQHFGWKMHTSSPKGSVYYASSIMGPWDENMLLSLVALLVFFYIQALQWTIVL